MAERRQRAFRLGQITFASTATLFVITAVSALLFRAVYPLAYQSVAFGTFDQAPEMIVLHDQRILTQAIQAAKNPITHIGIYTTGPVSNIPESRLQLTIHNSQGQVIYDSKIALSALIQENYTIVNIGQVLPPNTSYRITLQTEGVPLRDDFAIGYEPEASNVLTDTHIALKRESATPSRKDGHYALVGITKPTPQLFSHLVATSRPLQVSMLALIVFWATSLRYSRRLGALLDEPLTAHLPAGVSLRELLAVTAFALAVSLFVIFPYFQNPSAVHPTLRDAHRALVYLGIARDAALENGEFALWDPYTCGGIPLLANAESSHAGLFFPFTLAFGEQWGLRLSILATLVIGFVGAYTLARQAMGSNTLFALLAASIFVFSSFQMVALSRAYYAWLPMCFIPWVFVFAIRGFRSPWSVIGASITVAFIFLGGSMHMIAYSLIGLWIVLIGYAFVLRSFKPLLIAALISMLPVPLAGVKLLPSAELQSIATLERGAEFAPPLTWLPRLLLDRNELTEPTYFMSNGDQVTVRQFMSYVGIIPLLLFLFILPKIRSKKYLPFAIMLTLSFLLMFGLPPHNIIQHTPVFREILREPVRANILFILAFGQIVAAGGALLFKKIPLSGTWARAIPVALVAIAIADIVTAHQPLHRDVFTHPVVPLEKQSSFIRTTHAYRTSDDEYYTAGYINYAANQGMTDICPVYLNENPLAARGLDSSDAKRPYHGEVYLAGNGTTAQYKVHANTVTANISPDENTYVVLNQNFYPGWRTADGKEVFSYHGLIAAPAAERDQTIAFFYRPASYLIGLFITLLTLCSLFFSWLYYRFQNRLSHDT